jgi:cytochrome o ubiquinol oxidase subunit 1
MEDQWLFRIALLGTLMIAGGIAAMLIQFVVSFMRRDQLRDFTGDPWDGRTLEWATSSPPPAYNFAFTPRVHDNDTFADMKKMKYERPLKGFLPIHMPSNTWAGIVIAGLSAVMGFGLIWQMWLLVAVAFVAMMAAIILHTFNYKRDYYIPAEEVTATEAAYTRLLESHV